MSENLCIGIDVSKDTLDVASSDHQSWSQSNDEAGFEALIEVLRARPVELIVLEASGGYEAACVAALAAAKLPVIVVNPRQVRDFAKATGRLAKTIASMRTCWRNSVRSSNPKYAR